MDAAALNAWEGHLAALGQRIAAAAAGLDAAHGDAVRPTSIGLGDASWALDEACEAVVATWFEERAREGPLSLLTEHHGWRHRGPDGEGGWRELNGFAHGGPRLACDPGDGTRHLLLRHRPAWSLIALAGPGPDQPRQRDVDELLGLRTRDQHRRADLELERPEAPGPEQVRDGLALAAAL